MGTHERHNEIAARMIEHVASKFTDQAAATLEVPASAYTDDAQWRREMDLIFLRVPVMVGVSHEIPEPGDYKACEFLGRPLLITRQDDGSVRVMLNVCTHRGMVLTPDGTGNRKRFVCKYHAWSFGHDGELQRVAGENTFGSVDKCSRGLTQLPCRERGGLIFAVLTPGVEIDFDAWLGGMIEDIEEVNFPAWHFSGTREITGANWKVAYDGYLEGYHFASAHTETIYPRTYSNIMHFDAYGPHLLIGFPQRGIIEKLKDVPPEDYWQQETVGYDFIRLLFPNVSIFVAPEMTQVAQLIPGPTVDRNITVMYYFHRKAPASAEETAANETMIDWLKGVVQEEDYDLGLQVQRGLQSGAIGSVVFGRNERGNQYVHRWVEWFLADDPALPKPTL